MSIDIKGIISKEFSVQLWQCENALQLRKEGGTIPFIARYRKERTGELNENQLSDIFDRFDYLTELEERKDTILKTIEEQGKLTDELRKKIEECLVKTELEDLYLPYKPKKRTRATIAREKGLEPLAIQIKDANRADSPVFDLLFAAKEFISEEKGVLTEEDALKGAADILAEEISEIAELRAWTREFIMIYGIFKSSIKAEFPEGSTKYEMYRDFSIPVKSISAHVMLALRRGESEGILNLELVFDENEILEYFNKKNIFTRFQPLVEFYVILIKDAFNRLMKTSVMSEVRLMKKETSDEESIRLFGTNLRELLLASPAGMKPTLGVDPGFRTGCKAAVMDDTGKFLEYHTIFPFQSEYEKQQAKTTILNLISRWKIQLIAIGNGTASRETDIFITDAIKDMKEKPVKVIVNESGASIYSASKLANEEFPELDLTIRGAISIGRRLQDPLAELVKIDPKSIGVGQYQHDVDQKLLKKKLEETVVSCVNYVGVDLNTASKELLQYVSGINPTLAGNIIEWRNQNGAFNNRKQILKVPKFGAKTFELAAGFLRIRNGDNLLDNTGVHPESYKIVEKIADDLQLKPDDFKNANEKLKKLDLNKYVTENFGLPTLKDIITELQKPGRDPREEFKYASFSEGINQISDLRIGMELEGVVTNITNFGAFVDIGVHQDGLVHLSNMADRFIKSPSEVVKVGQIVKVTVIQIDEKLKRIGLSMKKKGIKKDEPKGALADKLAGLKL